MQLKRCKYHEKNLIEIWIHVVFTNEKRFVLLVTAGEAKIWAFKRLKQELYSKEPTDGHGEIVCAGTSWEGKIH